MSTESVLHKELPDVACQARKQLPCRRPPTAGLQRRAILAGYSIPRVEFTAGASENSLLISARAGLIPTSKVKSVLKSTSRLIFLARLGIVFLTFTLLRIARGGLTLEFTRRKITIFLTVVAEKPQSRDRYGRSSFGNRTRPKNLQNFCRYFFQDS